MRTTQDGGTRTRQDRGRSTGQDGGGVVPHWMGVHTGRVSVPHRREVPHHWSWVPADDTKLCRPQHLAHVCQTFTIRFGWWFLAKVFSEFLLNSPLQPASLMVYLCVLDGLY